MGGGYCRIRPGHLPIGARLRTTLAWPELAAKCPRRPPITPYQRRYLACSQHGKQRKLAWMPFGLLKITWVAPFSVQSNHATTRAVCVSSRRRNRFPTDFSTLRTQRSGPARSAIRRDWPASGLGATFYSRNAGDARTRHLVYFLTNRPVRLLRLRRDFLAIGHSPAFGVR